jgi:hypothetical protein
VDPIPARIDALLVIGTGVVIVGFGALVTPLLLDAAVPWFVRGGIGLFAFGTVAVTLGISVPVGYAFEEHGIAVRAGVLRLRFAYRDLSRCVRVLSPLSGPSWSWVRVRLVMTAGGWIEIAPRDREAFVAELLRRAPHVQVDPRAVTARNSRRRS